jgi:hypothetical protein
VLHPNANKKCRRKRREEGKEYEKRERERREKEGEQIQKIEREKCHREKVISSLNVYVRLAVQ